MTRRDREEFRLMHGYEPCFKSWGSRTGTHVCRLRQGHTGGCECQCGFVGSMVKEEADRG